MKLRLRRNERAQLHVVEAIIVGVLVFTILFVTSVFRLPTSPATFQQAELSGLARDTLVALLAKPPADGADCNEPGTCPFSSELERMISLSLGYQGTTFQASPSLSDPDSSELVQYLVQALPPGTRYILSYSNGVTPTTIYPIDAVPPALDISVGHLLVTFRWDQWASQVDGSMIIRIGEQTGFKNAGAGAVTFISDPLNRIEDHNGDDHLTTLVNAAGTALIADNATYGTYQIKYGAGPTTAYFTIVPPGIFGAGSAILSGDRDNSTSVLALNSFTNLARYNDTSANGFDVQDVMYLDLTAPLLAVSSGDLRLSAVPACRGTAACPAGSYVESTDADAVASRPLFAFPSGQVRAGTTGSSATSLQEGDGLYFDANDNGVVESGERRLSRVGPYAFGSIVDASSADVGQGLATLAADFTSRNVVYADLDGGNDVDIGEPVYLDLVGHGQTAGLESYDVHLSAKGNPTARFVYDVQMAVWYGI
jgi:hypothetical protein